MWAVPFVGSFFKRVFAEIAFLLASIDSLSIRCISYSSWGGSAHHIHNASIHLFSLGKQVPTYMHRTCSTDVRGNGSRLSRSHATGRSFLHFLYLFFYLRAGRSFLSPSYFFLTIRPFILHCTYKKEWNDGSGRRGCRRWGRRRRRVVCASIKTDGTNRTRPSAGLLSSNVCLCGRAGTTHTSPERRSSSSFEVPWGIRTGKKKKKEEKFGTKGDYSNQ